jgi:DNA end-binding protein Ku
LRSIWTGAIQLGPLILPVKLGSAVKDNKLGLHMVRESDGSRINFKNIAENDGAEVPYDKSAKGYDTPDGSLVVLGRKDFEEAFGPKNRTATVLMFTDASNVPPMATKTSYWVQPGIGGERSYALLAQVLRESGKVGVITFAMRQRMAAAVLRPHEGYLALEALEWDADLIKPDFTVPAQTGTETELNLTRQLVEAATSKYDHTAQHDPSREALAAVIQGKIERGEVIAAPPRPDNVGQPQDLTAMLTAAVEAQKPKPEPAAPKQRARRKSAAAA